MVQIMVPFAVILLYILFFAISFLSFSLYFFVYLNGRSALVKNLIMTLVLLNAYTLLRIIWVLFFRLPSTPGLYGQIAILSILPAWYGMAIYYVPVLLYSAAGIAVTTFRRNVLLCASAIHYGYILFVFGFHHGAENILYFLKTTYHNFQGIVMFPFLFYLFYFAFKKIKHIDNPTIKKSVSLVVAATLLFTPWIAFDLFIKYNYHINFLTYDMDAGQFLLFFYNCIAIYIFFSSIIKAMLENGYHKNWWNNFVKANTAFSESIRKYEKSALQQEEMEHYYKKLVAVMDSEKPYLNPELKFEELAAQLGTTRNKLSQILNQYGGQNFYHFINSYRINKAISLIHDMRFSNSTLLDIAFQSGFNSKATFNLIFKTHTGKTPSQYRKDVKKTG